MPLLEHLQELRRRLFFAVIAIAIGMVLGYVFFGPIFDLIKQPYCHLPKVRRDGGPDCQLYVFGVIDQFKVRLRVAMYVGIIGASPIWLYQLWAFITPGLHRNERRWTNTFVISSVLLFAAGVFLAYLTLAKGLSFLLGVGGSGITTLVGVNTYLTYFTAMVLVFGIAFEFPLLLLMLNLTGVLTGARMLSWWRPMVFGITVFAAIATPSQDPITMTALAAPLVALYFLTGGVARMLDSRKERRAAAESSELPEQLAPLGGAGT